MISVKRLIVLCVLPSFLVGCAEFYGSQPPAPVYDGKPQTPKSSAGAQKKSKSRSAQSVPSKEVVKTQPLKEFSEIKSEPLPPTEQAIQPFSESTPVDTQAPASPSPVEAQTQPLPSSVEVQTPPAPPAPELTPFEPIEATAPLSPVVNALVSAANQNTKSGDLDSAAAAIERAIRIEPRNATLFYKLALLRLKQSKPRLAEDLAKKSALLASTDNTLKKHCWLLIAHAREIQQDFAGAKEARSKADSF
ncbi:tetratricopeptide repeat protein [Methylobacter sp. Wu8]|uniref:tetratricopeptide repeat protein n=1 Tax=Methylobacter sp. Wu8 TaxID=3118457 RepID=UPI002F33B336